MNINQTPMKNVSTENMIRWGIIALVIMMALLVVIFVGPKLASTVSSSNSDPSYFADYGGDPADIKADGEVPEASIKEAVLSAHRADVDSGKAKHSPAIWENLSVMYLKDQAHVQIVGWYDESMQAVYVYKITEGGWTMDWSSVQ